MKLHTSIARCLLVGAVAVLSASMSKAALLDVITDKDQWDAQVPTATLIDFDHASGTYVPLTNGQYAYVPSVSIAGVTITGLFDNGPSDLILSNYNSWFSGTVVKGPAWGTGHITSFHIVLPAGVTGWGVDLIAGGDYGTYTINIGGATYTTPTSDTTSRTFYGFVLPSEFSSVDISYVNRSTNGALDNMVFGLAGTQTPPPPEPTETPEAATLLLCGTGLWSMSRFVRRTTSGV